MDSDDSDDNDDSDDSDDSNKGDVILLMFLYINCMMRYY